MGLLKIQNLEHKYGATKAQFLRKKMGHNPPYRESLHHQRILVVEPNTSLKGPKNTPTILDP